MRVVHHVLSSLLFMPGVFLLISCAFSGNFIEGQVLEAGTNKPLAGAIVIARWGKTYSSIADTTTVCVHVKSAITDEQGRFRLPTWHGKTPSWGTDIFKPGYERAQGHYGSRGGEYDYALKPFSGTHEEKMKLIRTASISCGSAGGSQKNLLLLYRALYKEAQALAMTKSDKLIVNDLLRQMDIIELPYEEALKRTDERN